MIDTHVHLQHTRYQGELSNVIARATAAGVDGMVIPGTDLESSAAAVELAKTHSNAGCALYAAVGIHPTSAHLLTDSALDELRDLASQPRVVAIGEIGLDYYWPRIPDRGWYCPDQETQRAAFEKQLALATDVNLPVIIHDRDAHQETLELLADWMHHNENAQGTLHSYAGGTVHLARVVELGLSIGVDGPVTFKKAEVLQAVCQQIPLDRLLLETDGPYLTPQPHRGKRNEPAYLEFIAERIAALRDIPIEELKHATSHNARKLFRL